MRRVLLKTVFAAAVLTAGCASFEEWRSGTITPGIPVMREKLPRTVKVYFADPVNINGYVLHERNRKQVQGAFGRAFDSLDVAHSDITNGCTHVIHVVVDRWDYSDSGFFGPGDRDEVHMSVLLQDIASGRVVTRSALYAENLDVLVGKYVRTLFEDD